jgi:hypothetical protein
MNLDFNEPEVRFPQIGIQHYASYSDISTQYIDKARYKEQSTIGKSDRYAGHLDGLG